MQGSFTRCMGCQHKRMEYFSDYNDPRLKQIRNRKLGFRDPGTPLNSMFAVVLLILAMIVPSGVALAATSDTQECKDLRAAVIAQFNG